MSLQALRIFRTLRNMLQARKQIANSVLGRLAKVSSWFSNSFSPFAFCFIPSLEKSAPDSRTEAYFP